MTHDWLLANFLDLIVYPTTSISAWFHIRVVFCNQTLAQIKAVQISIRMKCSEVIRALIRSHPSFSKSNIICGSGDAVIDLTYSGNPNFYRLNSKGIWNWHWMLSETKAWWEGQRLKRNPWQQHWPNNSSNHIHQFYSNQQLCESWRWSLIRSWQSLSLTIQPGLALYRQNLNYFKQGLPIRGQWYVIIIVGQNILNCTEWSGFCTSCDTKILESCRCDIKFACDHIANYVWAPFQILWRIKVKI